jgi:TonB family protein
MFKPNVFLIAVIGLVLASVACKKPAAPAANNAPQSVQNATPPVVVKRVHAAFPKELWSKPGTVGVAVLVKEDGKIGEVKVMNSPHPELNQLAIDAVKQWEFQPAHKDGKAVASVISVGVNFQPPTAAQNAPATSAQPGKK